MTEEGVEFKGGMISGGIQSNIANVNLGTFRLDNEWNELSKEVKKLDLKLEQLKEEEKSQGTEKDF